MVFSGDSLLVTIPEFGLSVKWDGLAAATIRLNQDTPTLGLCGNNDGESKDLGNGIWEVVIWEVGIWEVVIWEMGFGKW